MKSFIKEFKAFALTGNVFDMAIGIILGGAISALVKSLVDNVISPIIGMTFGTPDFSRITLGPIMIGSFINAIIAFLILAFILFLMIKGINKMKRKPVVEEAAPSLSNEEILLAEIRDLLRTANRLSKEPPPIQLNYLKTSFIGSLMKLVSFFFFSIIV